MKRKATWIALVCLMVMSLILASCANSTTASTTKSAAASTQTLIPASTSNEVRKPSSVAARQTRMAISLRLATSSFLKGRRDEAGPAPADGAPDELAGGSGWLFMGTTL